MKRAHSFSNVIHGAVLTVCLATIAGCASQAYSSFLAEQRNRCYSVPKENYEACMNEAKERYEEYKQAKRDGGKDSSR